MYLLVQIIGQNLVNHNKMQTKTTRVRSTFFTDQLDSSDRLDRFTRKMIDVNLGTGMGTGMFLCIC
jgi:hypothetical protein